MPRIILIVVTLLLCPALVSLADKRRVGSGQEAEVQEFLDRQIEAFEKRDLSALMTMLAPEASVVMLGNGPNERWVGPESIKRSIKISWPSTNPRSSPSMGPPSEPRTPWPGLVHKLGFSRLLRQRISRRF